MQSASRFIARRGMASLPKRQPSRHMDSKGRATLGRHLFNREKSITEYWYERTDPKAKLLAANIALGLGVAATYQYNHFSGNLDPDVQINKARRKNPTPHNDSDGVEVLKRRESRRDMHSLGHKMNRTKSNKKRMGTISSTAFEAQDGDLSAISGETTPKKSKMVRFKSNDVMHEDSILGRIRDTPI